MATPIEGVLNQAQKNSLEIVEFIFHIIQSDTKEVENVIFLDEVQLQKKQKKFFLDRLADIAEGTQYVFKSDSVHLKEKCEHLLEEPNRFIELSRQITADFAGRHQGQMSEGVFVVSLVKYLAAHNDWKKLIFLVKMDKGLSFSYSYKEVNGKRIAIVEENKNSLNENKVAIQKSALIDVTDKFAWDVLAFDRVKKPRIGDYFRGFLGVIERQQDSELTRTAHITVRKWAKKLPVDRLPPGEDVNTFVGRSLNYLNDHNLFNTDFFLDTVVRDEDENRKSELIHSLREALADAGVAGQQFKPQPNSLPKKIRKQIYETAEGVTLSYEGEREAAGITIEDLGEGKKLIHILTNRLITKD
ncbi:MAG: nucleoid-associated protein [Methylococcales bacterium]|nr:nucleoid-associated protein [Methylococcales bacterium]